MLKTIRRSMAALGSVLLCLALFPLLDAAFLAQNRHWVVSTPATFSYLGSSVGGSSEWNKESLEAILEDQTRAALMDAVLQPEESLLPIRLVGRAELLTSKNNTIACAVLSNKEQGILSSSNTPEGSTSCLMVPLADPYQLKLLNTAYSSHSLSKSVLLSLNPLLVNRDGGLFDNLPWSTWTVDPQKRNRDAANNVLDPKYHVGKRDAYNVMMGKDWKGRSASLGNLAMRLKHQLEQEEQNDENSDEAGSTTSADESSSVLARRILELQIRELQMEMAEWDSELAIARNNNPERTNELEISRQECADRLVEAEDALKELLAPTSSQESESKTNAFLQRVVEQTAEEGRNAAPYRGAQGYAAFLDTSEDIASMDNKPFSSPYDVLRDIIGTQLNANIIGAVLENASLLEGTLALGGAIVLQRKTATKTMSINGETLSVNDEEEDFGNPGIKGGEVLLVECGSDEAIGMALACNAALSVEATVWERAKLVAERASFLEDDASAETEGLPIWEPLDEEISFLVEGEARNASTTSQTAPLRIPRTTTSLFDSLFEKSSSSQSSSLFPTDNPIQSLGEYDALSNEDKARTLMSLSNFEGQLPRPRVLRQWDSTKGTSNPLDELLLPLIDESVRRQYLIRDADIRQDEETLKELLESKSPRQVAKEKAEVAREAGSEDVAEWWENEAELYASLRADVTQDEGSYSRFLDRDEWYEREQRALRERNKKFKFGTLMDGIE